MQWSSLGGESLGWGGRYGEVLQVWRWAWVRRKNGFDVSGEPLNSWC